MLIFKRSRNERDCWGRASITMFVHDSFSENEETDIFSFVITSGWFSIHLEASLCRLSTHSTHAIHSSWWRHRFCFEWSSNCYLWESWQLDVFECEYEGNAYSVLLRGKAAFDVFFFWMIILRDFFTIEDRKKPISEFLDHVGYCGIMFLLLDRILLMSLAFILKTLPTVLLWVQTLDLSLVPLMMFENSIFDLSI